jgi:hypothetical protein
VGGNLDKSRCCRGVMVLPRCCHGVVVDCNGDIMVLSLIVMLSYFSVVMILS